MENHASTRLDSKKNPTPHQQLAKAILTRASAAQAKKKPPKEKSGRPRGFQPGHEAYCNTPKNPISLTALLREELARIPSQDEIKKMGIEWDPEGEGKPMAWWLMRNYVKTAVEDGNITIIKDVLDRIDGKPVQAISGPEGGPIKMQQEVSISAEDVRSALGALIQCGAIQVGKN